MATQIVMPKLSPTMEEGQIGKWLKKEGDAVSMGEPLAEIETDKASMEMQALGTGVLRKILKKEGDTVPLGEVIAIVGSADEDISALLGKAESGAAAEENKKSITENVEGGGYGSQQELAKIVTDGPRTQATIKGEPVKGDVGGAPKDQVAEKSAANQPPPAPAPPSGNGQQTAGRLVVSPLAARMAAEAGINLKTLSGSGPGGRIVKRDIEEALRSGGGAAAPSTEAAPAQAEPSTAPAPTAPQYQTGQTVGASAFRDEPITEMRRTIARRLTSSIGPVPHFFLTAEIEMDKAVELRRSLNELNPEMKVSLNDLIIKVVAVALQQHPQVNASYQDKVVRYYERSDIGVAVAIEDGLITPIIRSADTKSVGAIAREMRELAERARARKLRPEEFMGATFSVSNLGMFGIDEFTAVINPPEAAILAVGAALAKPVVRDGEVVVRQIMRVTMSCDHRVIDGATGAKFLQTFKQIMENPLYMLI
ncbi:MAG TPA: pyruvate dehydrogenase complex dihydrolipoamide acetyltransferase [Pyrinomonadaceae bacterium]|jgi:pyruvate dehydrogenase E2 component (dihydrolipoamide acetyltransferase)|nr:pyruvate dehydrogenase complex dihydrolipoamide acetyltransferase [Pyrinomonadaceae bacterium]